MLSVFSFNGKKIASKILVAMAGIFAFKLLLKRLIRARNHRKIAKKVSDLHKRQDEIFAKIASKYNSHIENIPIEKRKLITGSTILELVELLKNGKCNYQDVLLCFFERAHKIAKPLNLLADNIHLQEAFSHFDELANIKFDPEKPLANLPFALKDVFVSKNAISCYGFSYYCDNIEKEDGYGNAYFRNQLGMIPFLKGSTPQGNFTMESNSFIFGRATNPINIKYSVGGSSGGDAGLVAGSCVPFSIGADIAGSLRGPAFHCGVVTIKFTASRAPNFGYFRPFPALKGMTGIKAAAGYFTKSVQDQIFLWNEYYRHNPENHFKMMIPIPWRSEILFQKKKLRLGYIDSFSVFESCEALKRAIKETVDLLKKNGHELIPTTFPNFDDIERIFLSIQSANEDYAGDIIKLLEKSEPPVDEYKLILKVNSLPSWVRKLQTPILRLTGKSRFANLVKFCYPRTVNELYLLQAELYDIMEKFEIWMENQGFDALIIPPSALPAYLHSQSQNLLIPLYTFVFNSLDIPAGIVPVSSVKAGETFYKDTFNDCYTKEANRLMTSSEGLPLCVQVLTRKYQEEECLRVMNVIEQTMGVQKYNLDSQCFNY